MVRFSQQTWMEPELWPWPLGCLSSTDSTHRFGGEQKRVLTTGKKPAARGWMPMSSLSSSSTFYYRSSSTEVILYLTPRQQGPCRSDTTDSQHDIRSANHILMHSVLARNQQGCSKEHKTPRQVQKGFWVFCFFCQQTHQLRKSTTFPINLKTLQCRGWQERKKEKKKQFLKEPFQTLIKV